ncbi:MAG TPA: DUF5916 domain-containing protein [Vicinamibacteria bacterium]
MSRHPGPYIILNVLGLLVPPAGAAAAEVPEIPSIAIRRATGPITVDGDLSDPGWKDAVRIDTWFETNPGDNTPPPVKNVGYLAYDDRFLYAAFEFSDPDPSKIRAPVSDRDNVGSDTDYGGIIVDTRNDRKTAVLLLANPRGVQYDAITDDGGSGEDSSPDYFWDSKARITESGWVLEMRVPFSSLRYKKADPQSWGIMLYRNHPRQFRNQYFNIKIPRGSQCFICRSSALTGLQGLPAGGHLVVAPYTAASRKALPRDGLGTPLRNEPVHGDVGLDVKWTPSASTALDATVNPDFSQIESDVAQIAANERFALFFSEKRPFFLEGIELFSTPIQAVYTRTITSPRWGTRSTGRFGAASYTALVAEDDGGGSVILPGPLESDLADQDFRSWVGIGRVRRDLGRSFVSLLVTDREVRGGGHNRVLGPDFQWRPGTKDTITGQVLWSDTRTPARPGLAAEWDGRALRDHAADLWWSHSTKTVDWFTEVKDLGDQFRADDGFVPQVGYRRAYGESGYTFRPEKGFLRRLRTFAIGERSTDREGDLLFRELSVGAGMDGRWNSFMRFRYASDRVRTGDLVLPRQQFIYTVNANPSRAVSQLSLDGFVGQQIDFANNRRGHGADVTLQGTLRPTNHLELRLRSGRRWLNVNPGTGGSSRLFTAQVQRLRATYNFTARAFLRLIGQWVETNRDPSLYTTEVARRDGDFSGSALFAYKLNWQTVLFVGYGDNRALTETEDLVRADRQLFLKLSYALQR